MWYIMAYCSTFRKAKTDHYGPDCQTDPSIMKFPTNISSNGFGLCQQRTILYSDYKDKQGQCFQHRAVSGSVEMAVGIFFAWV